MDMHSSVAEAVREGRRPGLERLAVTLVESIKAVEVGQVAGLAARLVDVLHRLGGSDPKTLIWLRDGLAEAVDRLAEVQGLLDEKGRPLGAELAPVVRQLVAVLEALAAMPQQSSGLPAGVVTIEDAKRRRRDRQQSAAEVESGSAEGGRKRRG